MPHAESGQITKSLAIFVALAPKPAYALRGVGGIHHEPGHEAFQENITPFAQVLQQVTALQPVHYSWRTMEFPDRHFGAAQTYGLIAQDVEQVLPELVVTNDDGYQGGALQQSANRWLGRRLGGLKSLEYIYDLLT